jgi:hypothetical protein
MGQADVDSGDGPSNEGGGVEEQELSYERPEIVDYGDLVELTAEGEDGDCLDASFPAGTKKSLLTFSVC